MEPRIPFYGWKNAWLLFYIYMSAAGFVFYAFTAIFPVMIQATGWSRGDASIASSLNMLLMGFLVPLTAVVLKRIGSRKAIIIGLVILSIGLLLLGTVTTRMWHWILLWGVVIPIAVALCGFFPVQVTVMSWFSRKRATALGLVMTGAAMGGFIAQPVYTWFMQRTGAWQTGWLLSAGFVLVALIVSFWVRGKPEDLGQFPDGIDPAASDGEGESPSRVDRIYKTPSPWAVKDAFKTRALWLILGVMTTQGTATILIINHGILHITDLGYSSMQAASVLMFVILGSGIARLPMGWLGDRIEPPKIARVALVFMLISFVGFWKAPSFQVLLIAGPLFGICYGTLLIMISAMLANYYGVASFVGISAFISPFITIIGAAIPTAAGYAADHLGNYNIPFFVISLVIALSIFFSAFLAPPARKALADPVL